jgi:hypothetical protein
VGPGHAGGHPAGAGSAPPAGRAGRRRRKGASAGGPLPRWCGSLLAAVATAHVHPALGAGVAVGGLHGVGHQAEGGALAVEGVHVAQGAEGAELGHHPLALGRGLQGAQGGEGQAGQQAGAQGAGGHAHGRSRRSLAKLRGCPAFSCCDRTCAA